MRRVTAFDMPLFLCVIILVGLGIAFIYSASYPKALASTDTGGDGFYYAGKQILFALAVGLPVLLITAFFPLELYYRHPARKWFFWGTVAVIGALMIAVLFMKDTHGNRSWLPTPLGPIQPSEFAKVAVVVLLSAYLCRRPWLVKSVRGLFAGPAWFLIVPVGLIIAQKDLGTAFVLTVSTVVILLIAGVKFRYIGIPAGVLGVAAVLVVMQFGGSRIDRIGAWLDPEGTHTNSGYQVLHSLIAVGSGGLFGRGFCQSLQKWSYVPGAQNDSILAIIAEEMGFLLTLAVIFLPFAFLTFRGFSIAHRAPDEFGALVATGATVMLATQALVNTAVALNCIPTMGITLPFISSGGSSLIASMLMAGLLLNVSAMRPLSLRTGYTAPAPPAAS
jgi:cell division protein FtsW